jgi:hypothetical protein
MHRVTPRVQRTASPEMHMYKTARRGGEGEALYSPSVISIANTFGAY